MTYISWFTDFVIYLQHCLLFNIILGIVGTTNDFIVFEVTLTYISLFCDLLDVLSTISRHSSHLGQWFSLTVHMTSLFVDLCKRESQASIMGTSFIVF